MKNKVKPVIVTWDNESYTILGVGSLSISFGWATTEIEGSGHFKCQSIKTSQFKDIWDHEIKIIARPKRKSKWQGRLDAMHKKQQ